MQYIKNKNTPNDAIAYCCFMATFLYTIKRVAEHPLTSKDVPSCKILFLYTIKETFL